MCERFSLFKGERLNPKIEGDIHIKNFTSKYLERDLKPWPLNASSILETLSHQVVLYDQHFNNKKLSSVTSGLI